MSFLFLGSFRQLIGSQKNDEVYTRYDNVHVYVFFSF